MLEKRVGRVLEETAGLKDGARVIAALSGGADSTALLHALWKLSRENGTRLSLRALHVNHGIRGAEAARDAEYAAQLCRERGIPFLLKEADVPGFAKAHHLSEEESGRIIRKQAFREAAEAWEKEEPGPKVLVACAHNREDSAETILFNLSRGTGLKGLSGIPKTDGIIIRPLLDTGRREIEEFLTREGISWCTDSTNLSDDYTRNRIRHRILPELLEGVNSAAVDHILKAGQLIGEADAYFERQAAAVIAGWEPWNAVRESEEKKTGPEDGSTVFPLRRLLDTEPLIRRYVLKRLAVSAGGNELRSSLTARHIEALESLLTKETGRKTDLPCGMQAEIRYGYLCFLSGASAGTQEEGRSPLQNGPEFLKREILIDGDEARAELMKQVPAGNETVWFDADVLFREHPDAAFRTMEAGDWLLLENGGRKTVRSLFTDRKIPAAVRGSIPLFASGQEVLWIPGIRRGAAAKVSRTTKRILEVTQKGASPWQKLLRFF